MTTADDTLGAGVQASLGYLGRRWYVMLAGAAIGLLLASIYLRTTTYSYTTDMTVVPAQGGSGRVSGALGGLASIAGVNLSGGDTVSPIELYMNQLRSRSLAESVARQNNLMVRAFPGQWDERTRRWREPESALTSTVRAVKRLLGLPIQPWRAPDGSSVQSLILGQVDIVKADRDPIVRIRFDHPDPKFARDFLAAIHLAADGQLRRSAVLKSTEYIGHLKSLLGREVVPEQRSALAELLVEQERTRMLASSASTPFAAEVIDAPYSTSAPTRPRPALVLLGGFLLGLAFSAAGLLIKPGLFGRH